MKENPKNKELLAAVLSCDLNKVKTTLRDIKKFPPASIDTQTNKGVTPLIIATSLGHKPTVELLLSHKPNLNLKDKNGWTALHWAVYKGLNDIVELLLKAGAELNPTDRWNCTPIEWATKKMNYEMRALLEKYNNKEQRKNEIAKYLDVPTDLRKLIYEYDTEHEAKSQIAQTTSEVEARIKEMDKAKADRELIYGWVGFGGGLIVAACTFFPLRNHFATETFEMELTKVIQFNLDHPDDPLNLPTLEDYLNHPGVLGCAIVLLVMILGLSAAMISGTIRGVVETVYYPPEEPEETVPQMGN